MRQVPSGALVKWGVRAREGFPGPGVGGEQEGGLGGLGVLPHTCPASACFQRVPWLVCRAGLGHTTCPREEPRHRGKGSPTSVILDKTLHIS